MTEKDEKVAATTTKAQATKKPKKINKNLKSEVIDLDDGTKMTAVFPGTAWAQRKVYDPASMPNGSRSLAILYQNFMDIVIHNPQMDWSFFDDKVSESSRKRQIEVTDDDGTVHKYNLEFPGTLTILQMRDQATDALGRVLDYEFNLGIVQNIITNKNVKDLDYFDHHNGYSELMDAATEMLIQWAQESGVYDTMGKVDNFMNRMFR